VNIEEVFFIESHSLNLSKNFQIYKPLTNRWLDFYNFKRRHLAILYKIKLRIFILDKIYLENINEINELYAST